MKTIKTFYFLLLLTVCMTFSSCKDNQIAKDIQGTWSRDFIDDDDGIKMRTKETITFAYVEDELTGGTFDERKDGIFDMEMEDVEDSYITISLYSTIKGTYEILDGDLYLKYDINSLKLNLSPDDIELDIKDEDFLKEMKQTEMSMDELKVVLAEEWKETFLEELRKGYLDNHPDGAYPDVKIEGKQLSFTTADQGVLTYIRQ